MKNKLKVAAIQVNQNIANRDNLFLHTENLIKEAVGKSVELIVLPELFSTGYIPNYDLWEKMLTEGKSSLKWIEGISKKYGIYIGMGHVEIIDGEVLNTYVLSNPQGEIEGRGIKENSEAYIFKRGNGNHLIHSGLGLISVGICADNHFCNIIIQIRDEKPVLHLMPHAWSTPMETNKTKKNSDFKKIKKDINEFPVTITKAMGVPAVFVNQLGEMSQMKGILGRLMSPKKFKLQGHSKIIDSNGNILASINDEEGYIIAEVELKTATQKNEIPNYNGWTHDGSKLLRKIIIPLDLYFGKRKYERKMRILRKDINEQSVKQI